ncbi:hypothetical protein M8J77_009596 [Diaphorina citri]|nr:hypothetical protein M8J77_009596 [Diaphorina citri]
MMSSAALIFILDITIVLAIVRGEDSVCPGGAPVTYVKMSGLVPHTTEQPSILYAALPGMAITAECYNRCKHSAECTGFIIDYIQGACYKVNLHHETEQYLFSPNSSYFKKVCLKVPPHCIKRAWPVDIAPNTQLLGYQHTTITGVVDKWHCAQLCLTGKTEYGRQLDKPLCKSAQYQAWSRTCTLSAETKRSQPEAYGPDPLGQTDYIENQCAEFPDPPGSSCWHEPLYNRTITQVDLQIENIPIEQCRDRCETEEYFKCRGFTYRCPANNRGGSMCLLHSDDSHNRASLVESPCTTYVEKLTCIDLKVSCDRVNMLVTYRTPHFQGRLFALGHSDYCGVIGTGEPLTTLVLPLPGSDPGQYNQCGVIQARSNSDRTLATAVIVVQQHPIIQTIADRVVKVSCVMSDFYGKGLVRPNIPNITLETDFGVAEPKVQTGIHADSTHSLPSSITPHAHLRIVDLQHGGLEASETQLGQDLELAIDIEPPFNVSMVRAGHLVASSGDGRDSLLLLDYRGCPPDVRTFPALTPHPDPGVNALSAIFKAFRFPSSPILRFSLVLTFCETVCQPIDCGNGLESYGKRKQDATENNIRQKVPLQLAIIVRPLYQDTPMTENLNEMNPSAGAGASSRQILTHDETNTVCMEWGTVLAVSLAWLFVQFSFFICCCYLLYCRPKYKKHSDQDSLQMDFKPRHVTWASDNIRTRT